MEGFRGGFDNTKSIQLVWREGSWDGSQILTLSHWGGFQITPIWSHLKIEILSLKSLPQFKSFNMKYRRLVQLRNDPEKVC